MSTKYKFGDKGHLYFVSFSVVHWIDLFVRDEYCSIVVDSLKFCQTNKGLEIYAWCIMSSHLHLIISSHGSNLEDIMRDLKSHTSRELKKAIKQNQEESRREWILWMMERAGRLKANNKDFQLWQQGNHPIILDSNEIIEQKKLYIHNNPVKAGMVWVPEHFRYSSATDYAGGKGLLDIYSLI